MRERDERGKKNYLKIDFEFLSFAKGEISA
jgi:hypothetical protein